MEKALSHVTPEGHVSMVDVSQKDVVTRSAVATGFIHLQPETLALISSDGLKKGNVLATARIAGIQAAKQTATLIPLCHQLPLRHVSVDFEDQAEPSGLGIRARVKTQAQTGVEMEALTAVSVAALTIYDMCKAVDSHMRITEVTLQEKLKAPLT